MSPLYLSDSPWLETYTDYVGSDDHDQMLKVRLEFSGTSLASIIVCHNLV